MSDFSSMGRYDMDSLVVSYQETKNEKILRVILDKLKPDIRSWCRNDDEQQIARIFIWKAAQKFDPNKIKFISFARLSVARALQRVRNSGSVVKESCNKNTKRNKEDIEAWKKYARLGGDPPQIRESTGRALHDGDASPVGAGRVEDTVTLLEIMSFMSNADREAFRQMMLGNTLYGGVSRQACNMRAKRALAAARTVLEDRYQLRNKVAI